MMDISFYFQESETYKRLGIFLDLHSSLSDQQCAIGECLKIRKIETRSKVKKIISAF